MKFENINMKNISIIIHWFMILYHYFYSIFVEILIFEFNNLSILSKSFYTYAFHTWYRYSHYLSMQIDSNCRCRLGESAKNRRSYRWIDREKALGRVYQFRCYTSMKAYRRICFFRCCWCKIIMLKAEIVVTCCKIFCSNCQRLKL